MVRATMAAVLFGAALLAAGAAQAHGVAAAKHGGVVQVANDLSFELVARPDGAAIYIEDHGKPLAPTGMSGRLTVLKGAERSEANLVAAGDRLEAKGLTLGKSARAVAAIRNAQGQAFTVRFVMP